MPEAPTSLLARAQTYRRTPEFSKLFRYATVSVVSTIVSLAMLYVFYRVVGLSALWANVIATAIATVPSYYLNRTWAWGRTGRSHFMREVAPFWVIAFISLVLSSGAVSLAAHEAHHLTRRHDFQTLLVLFANFFTYAVMWVAKFTIFNKLLFADNAAEQVIDLVPVEAATS